VVVGGEGSFVRDKFEPHLRRMEIAVGKHWEWRTTRFGWPTSGIDLVVMITDMMNHQMNDRAIAEAARLGVPVAMTVHKWSVAQPRLERTLMLLQQRGSRAFVRIGSGR